jgi:transposase
MRKVIFNDEVIKMILEYYEVHNLSCDKIGKKFGVSKRPINSLLKKIGKLRESNSNGVKKELSQDQHDLIKDLYLNKKMTAPEIANIMKMNKNYVDKYLSNSGYRRSKSESISIRQKGKKRSERVIEILKNSQQKLAKSGKRVQTGGICRVYIIGGVKCQGSYEKFYIEKIINDGGKLPNNANSVDTPFGVYYPDFILDSKFIEIKCDYTYDILVGKKINRFTKKFDTTQYKKIQWVNNNIKPVEILIVDKKNDKIIKKEIE